MDNEKTEPTAAPAFDRRRGPRRIEHFDPETGERRTYDRRKTPGVEALFDRLLGVRETIPKPPPGTPVEAEDEPKG